MRVLAVLFSFLMASPGMGGDFFKVDRPTGGARFYLDLLKSKKNPDSMVLRLKVQRDLSSPSANNQFSMFCDLRGKVTHPKFSDEQPRVWANCATGVETVSNDDDETLSVDLSVTGGAKEREAALSSINYVGDGTFLGHHMRILLGPHWQDLGDSISDIPLKAYVAKDKNLLSSPVRLGEWINAALAKQINKKLYSEETGSQVAIHTLGFDLDTRTMELHFSARLGKTGSVEPGADITEMSILKKEGELSSGLVTSEELLERMEISLFP